MLDNGYWKPIRIHDYSLIKIFLSELHSTSFDLFQDLFETDHTLIFFGRLKEEYVLAWQIFYDYVKPPKTIQKKMVMEKLGQYPHSISSIRNIPQKYDVIDDIFCLQIQLMQDKGPWVHWLLVAIFISQLIDHSFHERMYWRHKTRIYKCN